MVIVKIARLFKSSAIRASGKFKEEAGGPLVETALVMPLLLLLLLGGVEFGLACYASIETSNAALAGVQYGAQSASTAGDVTGIQNAAANGAPNLTLTTTAFHTCICSDGSSSTCLSTDCSTSHIETILTVQTQTTFTPGFRLPGLPSSFTLHGQAIQKVLQ